MSKPAETMYSIWYFVGIILTVMGGIILATGLYNLAYPPEPTADGRNIFQHLHPSAWWGAFMVVCGLVYLWFNRKPVRS